jgi:hypothetical protein
MTKQVEVSELQGPLREFMEQIGGQNGRARFDEFKLWLKNVTPALTPATFIGKGWSYAEARDSRSATLGLLDDYSRVQLSTKWLQDKKSIDGETRRRRILEDQSSTPLNCDHFLNLWNNKKKIPESWKEVGVITFDGDVLRDPNGSRCVLCLYWSDGQWHWGYYWLDDGWGARRPSAVLAS